MIQRTGAGELHGKLVLARNQARGPVCGGDYFASVVMPRVIDPICSQCHVPGGLAQAAPFKVTPGNPAATAASAVKEVNPADPTHSKLIEKPLGNLGHGGGQRFQPGSPEAQILLHWIALVTAPGCDLGGPGGGGGSGGTGADLYAANCASCHGADARGLDGRPDIRCNRDVGDVVRNGRSGPAGVMPAFANLADADIAKIQAFLDGLCPVASVTGASLFTSNCSSCHGADANGVGSTPGIRCNRSIHDVVLSGRTGPSGTMPRFVMTDAEIALVQAYLVGLCPIGRTGGADLFASNCASCHGIDATGSATAPSVRCATRVMDAVQYGRGERMPSLPALAPSEVTAVQSWLDGLCTASGRQASDLYAGNCSTCHGAGATGGQDGLGVRGPDIHCNREIAAPVVSGQGTDMPAFPALGGSDVTSLQQYLETTFCPVGTATGADLYASNCASCHGTEAAGTDAAPSVRCATLVADAMREGRGPRMPSFPAFVPTEVTSVQSYLTGVCNELGRPGSDLYLGNCSTCHGTTTNGGQNGLGVHGPDIRCTPAGDYSEKVRFGDDGMPAFPALGSGDITAIVDYVHGAFCTGD